MNYQSFFTVIFCMGLFMLTSCKDKNDEPTVPDTDIPDTEVFVVHSPSMEEFEEIVVGKMWAYVQTGYYDAEGNSHENVGMVGQHPTEAFWFHENGIFCEYFWMYYKDNDQCTYNPETGMITRFGKYNLAKLEMQADGNVSLTYDFDAAVFDDEGNPLKGSYAKTVYAPATDQQIKKYSALHPY